MTPIVQIAPGGGWVALFKNDENEITDGESIAVWALTASGCVVPMGYIDEELVDFSLVEGFFGAVAEDEALAILFPEEADKEEDS